MKRLKEVEIDVCDACGAEHAWTKCESCNKVLCDDCGKLDVTEYWNGVYDGWKIRYCAACIAKLTKSKESKLFNALLVVQTLRREYEGFLAEFEPRQKEAEENLRRLGKD
jgi:hypothetical protein